MEVFLGVHRGSRGDCLSLECRKVIISLLVRGIYPLKQKLSHGGGGRKGRGMCSQQQLGDPEPQVLRWVLSFFFLMRSSIEVGVNILSLPCVQTNVSISEVIKGQVYKFCYP